jgi:ferrous iron transport protein A
LERSIANLRVGEQGIISEISFESIPLALLEMGCMPGESVELIRRAPLKDPLYIRVNGSYLAIREETAKRILITQA